MGLPIARAKQVTAVIDAWPAAEQIYTSPIAGDPDTTISTYVGQIQQHITGFLLPKAGFVTEIGVIAQGGGGAGASQTVRLSLIDFDRDSAAATGLAIGSVLHTDTTTILDNIVAATHVPLLTGLNVAVPSQFGVCFKQALASQVGIQAVLSAGPVPGMIGTITGANLIATPSYTQEPTQFGTEQPIEGATISAATFKGAAMYVKWKGA